MIKFIIINLFLIIFFPLAFLSGQVTTSLSQTIREISPRMFGYNGRSTEGPSWEDTNFLDLVKDLYPGTVRYPAGTQANYWDWRYGTFIEGSGKTSSYNIPIPAFVKGLPEETCIIYVVNMARPTPATGIALDAPEEVLRSDSVLQMKILDMLEALEVFDRNGKLPFAVELGNEFYFDNEHAAIYAASPEFYLDHAKTVAATIKQKYPEIKILLITTKGGTAGRDYWNNTVFNRLESDSDFSNLIHAVIQHHYINDKYGDQTIVSSIDEAKAAIAEGIKYTSERLSDYEMVPGGFKLWITEYGATKTNAEGMWASGLRGAAMTIGWMDLGEKIEQLNFHHITDDPNVINKSSMKAGPVGLSVGLLGKAARGMSAAARIEFTDNPLFSGNAESLHGYKFMNDSIENIYILNLGDSSFTDVNIDPLIHLNGERKCIAIHADIPYINPVFPGQNIEIDTSLAESRINIPPFSANLVQVKYSEQPSTSNPSVIGGKISVHPTLFTDQFVLTSTYPDENQELRLIDMSGRVHYKASVIKGISYHGPEVAPGIYLLQIRTAYSFESIIIIKSN